MESMLRSRYVEVMSTMTSRPEFLAADSIVHCCRVLNVGDPDVSRKKRVSLLETRRDKSLFKTWSETKVSNVITKSDTESNKATVHKFPIPPKVV